MSAVTLRHARTVAFALIGIAAVGITAFLVTRAVAAPDAADVTPDLLGFGEPVATADLDPDLPLDDALQLAVDELGLQPPAPGPDADADDAGTADTSGDGEPDDAPLLELPSEGSLPVGLARPTPPQIPAPLPTEAISDGPTADRAGADAEERPPIEDLLTPEAIAELEDGAPVGEDAPPTDDETDDVGVVDPLLPLLFDLDDLGAIARELVGPFAAPDFLDVCAAEFEDGTPVDCGDGLAGTVLPLTGAPRILAYGVDRGPRCARLVDVRREDRFPLRLSFDRAVPGLAISSPSTDLDPDEPGVSGLQVTATEAQLVRWRNAPEHPFDHCVLLPFVDGVDRLSLGVAPITATQRFDEQWLALDIPQPPQGQRPPVRVEPHGHRLIQIDVPTHRDLEVVATVITRDPEVPGIVSQCHLVESGDLVLEPGRIVELRGPNHRRTGAVPGFDPTYDQTATRVARLGGNLDEHYELCVRWEERVGDTLRVREREAFVVQPPPLPQVTISLISGTSIVTDVPEDVDARIRELEILTDPAGGERCSVTRTPETLTEGLPVELCRFALPDMRRGAVIMVVTRQVDGQSAVTGNRHIRLVADPDHPRHDEDCFRCTEFHEVVPFHVGPHVPARLWIAVTTEGRMLSTGWQVASLGQVELDDLPRLDVERTTIQPGTDPATGEVDPNRIDARIVADRPVNVRLVARPIKHVRFDDPVPDGCPAAFLPHAPGWDEDFRPTVDLMIDDACALTRYRFAIELTDEDGNRAVYGDQWSWLQWSQAHAGLGARDAAYIPGVWDPRLTTPGWEWSFTTEVRVNQVHPDAALPPGVYVGQPRPGPDGVTEVPEPGLRAEADRSRLTHVSGRLGRMTAVHGEVTGETPCIDRGRTFTGRLPRHVVVGDALHAEGQVRMNSLDPRGRTIMDGLTRCKGEVNFVRRFELPTGPDGRRLWVSSRDVAEAGEASIVMVSRGKPFADASRYRFQAIITIRVDPDARRPELPSSLGRVPAPPAEGEDG